MKVAFISLGCAKNLVNTEQMMALCRDAGHTLLEAPAGADAVVINTCGFIDSAKEEAIDTILSVAALKAEGQVGKILVTGCLTCLLYTSPSPRDGLLARMPSSA